MLIKLSRRGCDFYINPDCIATMEDVDDGVVLIVMDVKDVCGNNRCYYADGSAEDILAMAAGTQLPTEKKKSPVMPEEPTDQAPKKRRGRPPKSETDEGKRTFREKIMKGIEEKRNETDTEF